MIDSTKAAQIILGKSLDILNHLATDSVDCVLTDPPYIGFEGMETKDAYMDWFTQYFIEMQRVCRRPQSIVVSQPWDRIATFTQKFGFKTAIKIKNAMEDRRGADAFFLCQTDDLPEPMPKREYWPKNMIVASSHPNARNINKMSIVVKAMSRPGDVILDPFCGSAAIGVAGILLGRKYIGVEMDKARAKDALIRIEHALSVIN